MTEPIKKLIGFAAMPPERLREISRRGQAGLVAAGKRHAFNTETAKAAANVGWARRRGTTGS